MKDGGYKEGLKDYGFFSVFYVRLLNSCKAQKRSQKELINLSPSYYWLFVVYTTRLLCIFLNMLLLFIYFFSFIWLQTFCSLFFSYLSFHFYVYIVHVSSFLTLLSGLYCKPKTVRGCRLLFSFVMKRPDLVARRIRRFSINLKCRIAFEFVHVSSVIDLIDWNICGIWHSRIFVCFWHIPYIIPMHFQTN